MNAISTGNMHGSNVPQRFCFHCELQLGASVYPVSVNGLVRETCCRGCQAVAELISKNGLMAYYRNRAAPALASAGGHEVDCAYFDLPGIQASYVLKVNEHEREAALLLEGVTCEACVWLIEQCVSRIRGVTSVQPAHGLRRLRVTWDESQVKLSAILATIRALGYQAHLYDCARSEQLLWRERRTLLWRLFVAAFGMMQVMMLAFPAYVGQDDMPADIQRLMQFAAFAMTLPVMVWSALPFYQGAWRALRARHVNRDVPVSAGLLTAFAASGYAALGSGAVYFDSVCMFVFLLLGARYLELNARLYAAREQDRLARLIPAIATRLPDFPRMSAIEEVPVAGLRPGDVVRIKPGAIAPGDGVVIDGASSVNEALLTGESRPVPKAAGDSMIAGSVNGESVLVVRLTCTGQQTTVAAIVRLMDRALSARPHLASVADRMASVFVYALLLVVVINATAWWFIDSSRVLEISIALLVITCPCALSLATPGALVAATGSLLRRGILLTSTNALEALSKATHFVFDKTGTLTSGHLSVIGVLPLAGQSVESVLAIVAALESASEHPVGRALAAAGPAGTRLQASEVRFTAGEGVEGVVNGLRLRAGALRFAGARHGLPLPAECAFVSDDVTTVALANEREWLALITLGDSVRPDARHVVQTLQDTGHAVVMLSGDRSPSVARVAQRLGIENFAGDVTPAEKLQRVRELQQTGAWVAAVGDGVNDAPVLAQAQVSIAMANGADLTRLNADVTLLTDRIDPLLDAVKIARRTLKIIRQNFIWAVAYNAVAVPLAVMGMVTPLVAALGMSVSSLLVIGNALRLCEPARRLRQGS